MGKPPSSGTRRLSATLERELAGRLEAYCADERLSLSQGISRALERFLDEVQPRSEPPAVAPPKRATGG